MKRPFSIVTSCRFPKTGSVSEPIVWADDADEAIAIQKDWYLRFGLETAKEVSLDVAFLSVSSFPTFWGLEDALTKTCHPKRDEILQLCRDIQSKWAEMKDLFTHWFPQE